MIREEVRREKGWKGGVDKFCFFVVLASCKKNQMCVNVYSLFCLYSLNWGYHAMLLSSVGRSNELICV
jgi:hypothetical protein